MFADVCGAPPIGRPSLRCPAETKQMSNKIHRSIGLMGI